MTPRGPYSCQSCTGTVTFFFWLLCLVCLVMGMVIVGLTAKLNYFSRQFPKVAEHNYRTMRADMVAMERRLTQVTEQACGSPATSQSPQLQ